MSHKFFYFILLLLCYGCGSGFSIYIPSTEKIFRCCIIPYDSLSEDSSFVLQFRFVSDTNYSNIYYINTKDLSYIENKKYKKILEQKVLNELDVEWENEGGFWFFLKNIVSRI